MKDLSTKERAEYARSLHASLIGISQCGKASGLSLELSDDLAKRAGKTPRPNAILIPLDLLSQRALTATGSFTAGGVLVGTDDGGLDPYPRSKSVCIAAGAQMITGLTGNLAIARQTGLETLEWLAETDDITPSDETFGQLTLTPHRVAGATSISRQLEVATGGRAGQIIIESLGIGWAKALDRAALVGNGSAGEPLGLHYAAGIGTKTFGGAATWAAVTDMQSTAATANAETLTWVAHPEVRERWRNIQRFSGVSQTLWDSDRDAVAGDRALTTTAAPTTGILVGDFSRMVFGVWGESVEVLVDPITNSFAGRIVFTVNAHADCGHLRPAMVVRNADSAVQ